MIKYEKEPKKLQTLAAQAVEDKIDLSQLSAIEKHLAIQMINACGDPEIIKNIRFSESVTDKVLERLNDNIDILCDTDSAACGIKKKYLNEDPICLINKASVISQAKSSQHSRSMVAVDLWKPFLDESIVVIGNETTALARLIELLENDIEEEEYRKPTLIIATPVGFTGAEEVKEYLWKNHEKLNVPCIVLLGTKGGNDIATSILNHLLKTHKQSNFANSN
ncbi:MAG: precorrin-8X methylmutase [Putridiphycobacter sp.]